MSKDVIVSVTADSTPEAAEELTVLLVSTEKTAEGKLYNSLEEIKKEWEGKKVYQKAAALFGQASAEPSPERLIRRVKILGVNPVESAEELVTAIKNFRAKDDEWEVFLTDHSEDDYVKALAAFAEESEPKEAELAVGVEDHRKLYFAQTQSKSFETAFGRSAVIYSDKEEEAADAAWVGAVLPWYPQAVTWKFKLPSGLSAPELSAGEIQTLEENHINFVTSEYKQQYVKNGCCLNGEWIDVVLGRDWITKRIREKVYRIFTQNPIIPYTDAGFTMIASGVFEALDEAAGYEIIMTEEESGAGIYTVRVPKRSEADDEMVKSRRMPDLVWSATLGGAIHGVEIQGTLKVSLT